MASGRKKTYRSVDDVLQDIFDSDFEVDSSSEYGDLSSEEETLIDAGVDPDLESANSRYVLEFICDFQMPLA